MKHSNKIALAVGPTIFCCLVFILRFCVYGTGPKSLHGLPDLAKHFVAIAISIWLGYHAISILVIGLDGVGMVILPKLWYFAHLKVFAACRTNDTLKADYLSRLCRVVSRQLESNRSVQADLNLIERYIKDNLSNNMNRGMTTCVEQLCNQVFALEENESTGTCLSIRREVLQKTNRTGELASIDLLSGDANDIGRLDIK